MSSTTSHSVGPGEPARAADTVGALAGYVLFLAVIQLLWFENSLLPSSSRAGVLGVLTALGWMLAFRMIRPGKDGAPLAPATGRTAGAFAWTMLYLGLFELGRAYTLPPSSLASIALGGVALYAAEALKDYRLAYMGAFMVLSHLAEFVALKIGLSGGFATNAIFVTKDLGFIFAVVGASRMRLGAKVSGMGLHAVGLCSSYFALFLLSFLGNGYHGWLDTNWINRFYLLGFLLLGAYMLKAGFRFKSQLMVCAAVLGLYLRGLGLYVEFIGDVNTAPALFVLGVVLISVARVLEETPVVIEAPTHSYAGSYQCRKFGLRVAGALSLMVFASTGLRGIWNASLTVKEIPIALRGDRLPGVILVSVPLHLIEYEPDITPGTRLDVYAELGSLMEEDPVVVVKRAIAVSKGKPAPEALNPIHTMKLPGVFVQGRDLTGNRFEGVAVRERVVFELDPKHWGEPGHGKTLLLPIGRSGFPMRPVVRTHPSE